MIHFRAASQIGHYQMGHYQIGHYQIGQYRPPLCSILGRGAL